MIIIKPLLTKSLLNFLVLSFACFASHSFANTASGASAIYVYISLANCTNCNLTVSYLENDEYFKNNPAYNYLLEEKYSKNGTKILSDYLSKEIKENRIFYNDSLIDLIKKEFSYSSAILINKEGQYSVVEISSLSYLKKLIPILIGNNIEVKKILDEATLSDQLLLKIIDSDTFIIDRILSKVYKNGKQLLPKLYVSDIPGLVNFNLSKSDSLSSSYRIEFESIEKIENKYVLFVTGNQLRRIPGSGTTGTPRSILIAFDGSPDSLSVFTSTILEDPKGCYFDNYSVFTFNSKVSIPAKLTPYSGMLTPLNQIIL